MHRSTNQSIYSLHSIASAHILLISLQPIETGVVQIRETGPGNYPPVVYQPLRSPKSPYAKFGPGSSCTLPAKLGARLSNQIGKIKDRNNELLKLKEIDDNSPSALDQPDGIMGHQHEDLEATQLPEIIHPNSIIHDQCTDLSKPKDKHRASFHQKQHHIMTTDTDLDQHHQYGHRDTRSSSEENSNTSSDHSNGGYFSEDSSQSITDLCGSPLELKVQIRQCSDEKLLKKNLSQDNLLRADYISRPNEKCKLRGFIFSSVLFWPSSNIFFVIQSMTSRRFNSMILFQRQQQY